MKTQFLRTVVINGIIFLLFIEGMRKKINNGNKISLYNEIMFPLFLKGGAKKKKKTNENTISL